ncbi:MAG: diguanylate cyclase [Fimbriimonadaceae bacterium]|nr:diguanylate cyclase [Fimbriimonadaceae bacterium]
MRAIADIKLNRLTVPPDTDLGTALLLMQKEHAGAAAVIRDGEFIGFVTIESAVLSEPDVLVTEVMRGTSTALQLTEPVRQAAKYFVGQQADYLAVFFEDQYAGLLSALMLIDELGRSYDPLTGLSWSDRLRDWGVEQLEAGQEICVIFFDLNDFGVYNKRYGHVVGDRVLKGFGKLLNGLIDPKKDVLVRYGGDEFAIGTTRSREEGIALLEPIASKKFKVEDVRVPVGFSYGISGGKRSLENRREHGAATLDNLIALASQECLANKPGAITRAVISEPEQEPAPVQKHIPDFQKIAEHAAQKASESDSGIEIEVLETYFVHEDEKPRVVVTGFANQDGSRKPFRSSKPIGKDISKSIAEAVYESVLLG